MAIPTTLLERATQQRDAAKAEVTHSQQRLAKAQLAIAAAKENVAEATTNHASLEREADAIRQKLPAVATPADGEALLAALELLNIRSRARQGEGFSAAAELAEAQTLAIQAQASLSAASSGLANAEADLKAATQAQKQRAQWKTALGAAPLAALKAAAASALTKAPFTSADARLTADLPDKLRTRAAERRTDETNRLANTSAVTLACEDAVLEERSTHGGLAGVTAKARTAFFRAEAAVREFAERGQVQFEQAQASLAVVADKTRFPLTPEEADRLGDAGLKAQRGKAADEEKKVDDARKAAEDKQAALSTEVLTAWAAGKDPEGEQKVLDARDALKQASDAFGIADTAWRKEFKEMEDSIETLTESQAALAAAVQKAFAAKKNPDTDPAVAQAKADLNTAQDDLKQAESDYRSSNHGLLHAWAGSAPDATWRLCDQFEQAKAMLTRLSSADSAKLTADLDQAEGEYVDALLKADASDSVLGNLEAEQTRRGAREQNASTTAPGRLLSALRGDN